MRSLLHRTTFGLVLGVLVALVPAPAAAQGPRVLAYANFTTDVTLTTTTEAVVVTSPQVTSVRETTEVIVIAWAQLTTGAGTTTVTPRIRRGGAITSTLIGEANAETIKVAAGGTEPFVSIQTETIAGGGNFTYSFTLAQAGATGNGSALQGGIVVLAR